MALLEVDPVTLKPIGVEPQVDPAAAPLPTPGIITMPNGGRLIEVGEDLKPVVDVPPKPQAEPPPARPHAAEIAGNFMEQPAPPNAQTIPMTDPSVEGAFTTYQQRMARQRRAPQGILTPEERVRGVDAAGRAFANVASLGMADRFAAGADALMGQGTYGQNLQQQQARSAEDLATQGTAPLGAVAGMVGPAAATNRIAALIAGQKAGVIASTAGATAAGGAVGGFEGAMRSPDLTNMPETVPRLTAGAGTGAVFGGGANLAGRAFGAAGRLLKPEKLPDAGDFGAAYSAGKQQSISQRLLGEARGEDAVAARATAAQEYRLAREIAQRQSAAKDAQASFPQAGSQIEPLSFAEKAARTRAALAKEEGLRAGKEADAANWQASALKKDAYENLDVADRLNYFKKIREDADAGQSTEGILERLLSPRRDNLRESAIAMDRATPALGPGGAPIPGRDELRKAAWGVKGEHYGRRLLEGPVGPYLGVMTAGGARIAQEGLRFVTKSRMSDVERAVIVNSPLGKQLGLEDLDKDKQARIIRMIAAGIQGSGSELLRK